jgi:hypothetical protein
VRIIEMVLLDLVCGVFGCSTGGALVHLVIRVVGFVRIVIVRGGLPRAGGTKTSEIGMDAVCG